MFRQRRGRDFEHQRYVVAQARLDPVLVSTNHQAEGAIRPLFGHENIINVIAGSCPEVLEVRRFEFFSGLYAARHMVGADQPETCQVANRVDVVNRPSGLVPTHMIVEVARNDCRGRPQESAVSPKCLPQWSRIVLSSIAPLEFWAQTPRRWMGLSRPGNPLTETGAIWCRRSSWRCRSNSRTVVPKPAKRSPWFGYLPTQTREASASPGARATRRSGSAASDITATSGRSVIRASILRCNAFAQFHATMRIASAELCLTPWRLGSQADAAPSVGLRSKMSISMLSATAPTTP